MATKKAPAKSAPVKKTAAKAAPAKAARAAKSSKGIGKPVAIAKGEPGKGGNDIVSA